jgi:hypothetical protein
VNANVLLFLISNVKQSSLRREQEQGWRSIKRDQNWSNGFRVLRWQMFCFSYKLAITVALRYLFSYIFFDWSYFFLLQLKQFPFWTKLYWETITVERLTGWTHVCLSVSLTGYFCRTAKRRLYFVKLWSLCSVITEEFLGCWGSVI